MKKNSGNADQDVSRADLERGSESGTDRIRTGSDINSGEWKPDSAKSTTTENPETGSAGSGLTNRGRRREGLW